MFGTNEIVGHSFFKDMPERSLYVTSIFYTLQGEGPFAGLPAVFVRLGKCNLDCSFCDTYFDSGDVMSFEDIEVAIVKVLENCPVVDPASCVLVITGGEPTIQSNLPDFVKSHVTWWHAIQIETNGTQPKVLEQCAENAVIVISPKCLEKDGKPVRYLVPSAATLEYANALKFVVSADPDSPYHSIPSWAHTWAEEYGGDKLYVSPMNVYNEQPKAMKMALAKGGVPTLEEISTVIEKVSFWEDGLLNRKANQANHEYAAKVCMNRGYRLNLQMHLYCSVA
jgi:organic radical activating enzyme